MKIKQLIEALKTLDQEKIVVIADADEGYDSWLNIMNIIDEQKVVTLGGDYNNRYIEMTTKDGE